MNAQLRFSTVIPKIWAWPGLITLAVMMIVPIYASLAPQIEGTLFPVTSKVEFVDVHDVDGGLSVRMKFNKLRDCEYIGVTLDRNGVYVEFTPVSGSAPYTLATGERVSAPWFIAAKTLEGLRVRWVHRCNPLYITVSQGYP